MSHDAYYFGCWAALGHHLYLPGGRTAHGTNVVSDFPVRVSVLDAGLLGEDRQQVQGRAYLAYVRGWSILSFWDRSVDKRPASNSNFILRGTLNFDDAVAKAKAAFPEVWARFTFPVVFAPITPK